MDWGNITGEYILYLSGELDESSWENAFNQSILVASGGECRMLKLWYTDGFGWLFDRETHKITFILHECKSAKRAGTSMRSYTKCMKEALLQDIGYFVKIKNHNVKTTSELKALATEFGYTDVHQFIIDNFGMFLISSPRFVAYINYDDNVKQLIDKLEPLMVESKVSPSNYIKDDEMSILMDNFNVDDYTFTLMPNEVNLQDTGRILQELNNYGVND